MHLPACPNTLSDATLQSLAGPSVFARGQTYARGGAVENPELSPPQAGEQVALSAVVQGTQPYQTRLWVHHDHTIDGECDCPHAEDGHFCKHQVALALTLRGLLGGEVSASDPEAAKKVAAAAKRAQTQAQNRENLRQFLREQSAETLAERLWQWANGDRNHMAELKAWAAQARAGSDPKSVTQAITELLRHSGQFLDWREARLYAQRAGKVLDLLRPWLTQDPAQLRALCDHSLRRLFKVAERTDDSSGDLGGVVQAVQDLMLQALRASPPPAAWVERWFSLMEADPWGLCSETDILEAAGPAVQARYAEQAAQAWRNWLAAHPPAAEGASTAGKKTKGRWALHDGTAPIDSERSAIRRRYLNSLRQQGDVQTAIDVMRSHQAHAREHSELVRFCEAHGRDREAMQYAQAGHKRYPQDTDLEQDLLRCYERDGWDDEALAIRRRQLESRPSVAHYQAVLDAAERAGQDRAAYREGLFAWARAQEVSPSRNFWFSTHQPVGERQAGINVSVRLGWLLADEQLDEALALVTAAGQRCSTELLHTLASRLPAARNAEALPLLQQVFEHEMATATSPYAKPLALVAEICARMAPLERKEWLVRLRTQYKAKRNFMAGLPA